MRGRLVAAAVAVAAVFPAGCGTGRSGLTAVEQNQLLGLIAQARSSAAAGDAASAESALTELRSTVTRLRTDGVLDPARAARLRSVAGQALAEVQAEAAAAAARRAPRTAPAPAARPKPKPNPEPTPTPAPSASNPAQVVLQGVGALKTRVSQAVNQDLAKLKDRIAKLRDRVAGRGGGG